MSETEGKAAWSRRLNRAWLMLVGLTMVSLVAVLGFGTTEAGMAAAGVALAAAFYKARLVLDHFLDQRRAEGSWRAVFAAMLAVILGGLMATYVAAGLLN
jgi:hypothetical protein